MLFSSFRSYLRSPNSATYALEMVLYFLNKEKLQIDTVEVQTWVKFYNKIIFHRGHLENKLIF